MFACSHRTFPSVVKMLLPILITFAIALLLVEEKAVLSVLMTTIIFTAQ